MMPYTIESKARNGRVYTSYKIYAPKSQYGNSSKAVEEATAKILARIQEMETKILDAISAQKADAVPSGEIEVFSPEELEETVAEDLEEVSNFAEEQ